MDCAVVVPGTVVFEPSQASRTRLTSGSGACVDAARSSQAQRDDTGHPPQNDDLERTSQQTEFQRTTVKASGLTADPTRRSHTGSEVDPPLGTVTVAVIVSLVMITLLTTGAFPDPFSKRTIMSDVNQLP